MVRFPFPPFPRSLLGLPLLASLANPLLAATAQIDADTTYQTIVGFGAAGGFNSEAMVDFGAYELGVSMYRMGIEPRILPDPVSDPDDIRYENFTVDGSVGGFLGSLDTYRALRSRRPETKMIGSVWTPPAWMKDNNAYTGTGSGSLGGRDPDNRLSNDHYDDFAKFLVEYQKYMTALGMPLYGIGPQNEPYFTQSFDSCLYNGQEFANVVKAIGQAFDASSIDRPIIFGPEDMTLAYYGTLRHNAYVDALMANDVEGYFDVFATHGYTDGVQGGGTLDPAVYWNSIKQFGRPYWITEGGTGGHDWPTPITSGIGAYLHYALEAGNASAFVAWQLQGLADEHNVIGPQPTKKTYAAMHFWRYIRPGFVRIGAVLSGTDRNGLRISAYRDPAKRRFVVVAINTNDSARTLDLSVAGGLQLGQVDYFRTSASENFAHIGTVDLSDNNGSISLPALSMTTLVELEPVTGVSLTPSTLSLNYGESGQLTKAILPADATDPKVTWSSSNPAVATVDGAGVVTAHDEGDATITMTSVDGGFSASSEVNVTFSRWAFWNVDETGWVNTGDGFMGWLHVRKNSNWVYSLKHDGYLYLPESMILSSGYAWAFLPRTNDDASASRSSATATKSSAPSGPEIREEKAAVTNVALNKPVTTSGAAGESVAENLVDGNWDGSSDHRWAVTGYPQWVVIDLGELYQILETRFRGYQNRGYQYTISVSDDNVHYTEIVDRSNNFSTSVVFTDSVDASGRYVRLEVVGGGSYDGEWVNVLELEVMGAQLSVPVTGVSLSRSSLIRAVGQSYPLKVSVQPTLATNRDVVWTSSNPAVASVSSSGVVEGLSLGQTTITVTTDDGGFTATTEVNVNNEGAWGPWNIAGEGRVNTGSFIGWVYVRFDSNWVYLYELAKWAYLPETSVEVNGGSWVLISFTPPS